MALKVPQRKKGELLKAIAAAGFVIDLVNEHFFIAAIRGYYRQTMGDPNKNDRGIYDDAIFIVGEDVYKPFQANTDPSIYKKGTGVLVPGVYDVEKHLHKGQYAAWQIILDRLLRDGSTVPDVGRHGVNIHHGGVGTWSLACQTLPPETWPDFQKTSYSLADRYGKKTVKYVLIENK